MLRLIGTAMDFETMTREEMDVKMRKTVEAALEKKYGKHPDKLITDHLRKEWSQFEISGKIPDLAMVYALVRKLKAEKIPYSMGHRAGASLVLYLLGITHTNPLPPLYYCPRCKKVTWQPDAKDGLDLPLLAECPDDRYLLDGDGHDLPFRVFTGFEGDLISFSIRLPAQMREMAVEFVNAPWYRHIPRRFPLLEEQGEDFYQIEAISLVFDEGTGNQELTSYAYAGGNFDKIVRGIGLTRRRGTFSENLPYANEIIFQEDVYEYLLQYFVEKDAFRGMSAVCKGRGLPKELTEITGPEFADFCENIDYLPCKADVIEKLRYWEEYRCE